ncbi:MAG: anaerobic ribonucleoside-triphosphate reductase activating protein [Spirochaetales bacterium]|nr:anaerobic ribonucleoside-triphosphate reductase activating protein [Spirochaetales bacterium]
MDLPHSIGLQRTSLVDYPGKVASVIFLPGCNLRCSYCHNSDLAQGRTEGLLKLNEVIEYVKNRAPLMGGVVISGGEPLLYPGLPELVRIFHESGLSVKLDTNGTLPDRLAALLNSPHKPDFIAMDFKTSASNYTSLAYYGDGEETLSASVEMIQKSGIPHHFRATAHRDFVNTDMVDRMSEMLKGDSEFILNPFLPGNCLNPEFNNHKESSQKELLTLRDAFRSRGINCIVHSIENSCNTL